MHPKNVRSLPRSTKPRTRRTMSRSFAFVHLVSCSAEAAEARRKARAEDLARAFSFIVFLGRWRIWQSGNHLESLFHPRTRN